VGIFDGRDRANLVAACGQFFMAANMHLLGQLTPLEPGAQDIRGSHHPHIFVTEGLDTTGPMGTAMLTIMAAFAQLERDTMIERTRAGLAAAAANNRHGGRPRKVDAAAAARAKDLKAKGINAADIGKMLGVSRATIYRYLL
jgi:hypothetical protein